jgi:hypothetical protein
VAFFLPQRRRKNLKKKLQHFAGESNPVSLRFPLQVTASTSFSEPCFVILRAINRKLIGNPRENRNKAGNQKEVENERTQRENNSNNNLKVNLAKEKTLGKVVSIPSLRVAVKTYFNTIFLMAHVVFFF